MHWLTGTASTVMVGCVEGILGMRPDFYGLHLSPAIPDCPGTKLPSITTLSTRVVLGFSMVPMSLVAASLPIISVF